MYNGSFLSSQYSKEKIFFSQTFFPMIHFLSNPSSLWKQQLASQESLSSETMF